MVTVTLEPFGGMGWFRVGKIFINEKQLPRATIAMLRQFKGLRELNINSGDEEVLAALREALPEARVAFVPVRKAVKAALQTN